MLLLATSCKIQVRISTLASLSRPRMKKNLNSFPDFRGGLMGAGTSAALHVATQPLLVVLLAHPTPSQPACPVQRALEASRRAPPSTARSKCHRSRDPPACPLRRWLVARPRRPHSLVVMPAPAPCAPLDTRVLTHHADAAIPVRWVVGDAAAAGHRARCRSQPPRSACAPRCSPARRVQPPLHARPSRPHGKRRLVGMGTGAGPRELNGSGLVEVASGWLDRMLGLVGLGVE
jgi:hypothetical protein